MLCGFAILLMAMIAFGCAGPGTLTKIPVDMPKGEKATIIAHNQQVPDWMLAKDKLALNYIINGKEASDEQLKAVAATEKSCRIYTDTVRPNDLVAVGLETALYFAVGFTGIGLGSQAFIGANSLAYGAYGGAATGLAGTANGIVKLGGKTYTFENCGQTILGMFPGYEVRVLQKSPY